MKSYQGFQYILVGRESFNHLTSFLSINTESHGVDPVLLSLNWFLCLFVDSLPVNTYLHIWDAFLFEGSKVTIA